MEQDAPIHGRQSSVRYPGDRPALAHLPGIIHPIKNNRDKVEAFVDSFPTATPEQHAAMYTLLGLPSSDYQLAEPDGTRTLKITTHNEPTPDRTSYVIVDPFDENPATFLGEVELYQRPLDMAPLIRQSAVVRHPHWYDHERLRHVMDHWDDHDEVTDQDVLWCFKRNSVPVDAYMRVRGRGLPDGSKLFEIGTAPDHSYELVLNPHMVGPAELIDNSYYAHLLYGGWSSDSDNDDDGDDAPNTIGDADHEVLDDLVRLTLFD